MSAQSGPRRRTSLADGSSPLALAPWSAQSRSRFAQSPAHPPDSAQEKRAPEGTLESFADKAPCFTARVFCLRPYLRQEHARALRNFGGALFSTLPCFVGGRPGRRGPGPLHVPQGRVSGQLHPDVPPQVLHFMQVPLRTSV